MKNRRMIVIAVGLVVCVAVMFGIYLGTRPETVTGGKNITVTVVHKDGTEKVFTCQSRTRRTLKESSPFCVFTQHL